MSTLHVVATVPWADLIPLPQAPIALAVSFALSFWYGYRHPEEY